MFADPLPNISLAGVAQTLPRTKPSSGKNFTENVYSLADGSLVVTLRQERTTDLGLEAVRMRMIVEKFVFAADPTDASVTRKYRQRHEYQFMRPTVGGFTETDVVNVSNLLTGFLTATSNTNLKKMNGTEV